MEVKSALVCLDCTEEVLEEAIEKNCGMVIAHHPVIFGGVKRLTGENYVERVVMKAIRNDIALYAAHTNLDNVPDGVNAMIAEKIGLKDVRILAPKQDQLRKLVVFCPVDHGDKVRKAMFNAGAGAIGDYDECSFNLEGFGTFRAGEGADPYVGGQGAQHHEQEQRIEVIYPVYKEKDILAAMIEAHPYEEVAHDIFPLANEDSETGSGMIGQLEVPLVQEEFLAHVRERMACDCIRYTSSEEEEVKTVAICGGAGSFLLPRALKEGADAFVTSDLKYHQFFDAEGKLMIADIGHYESERYTIDLFVRRLQEKFPKFAVHSTAVNTNPVKYFC